MEMEKKSGITGKKISDMIKKAIDDGEITTSEYEKILAVANEDGIIDSLEKRHLKELQEMLANKTIKRVPG